MSSRNGATKVIYKVWAPAEGDSPEDATWWYFRTAAEADDFANDGWGSDYGITNYSEGGPFAVIEQSVSREQYTKLQFTSKQSGGNWRTGKL